MYFYAFDKYDIIGEFSVHKASICSNMKSPTGLPKQNQIACCTNANNVLSSVYGLVFSEERQPLKEEDRRLWLHSTYINWCARTESSTIDGHWIKPHIPYNQEREEDEIMRMFATPGTYI
jgi:hypothetical protein